MRVGYVVLKYLNLAIKLFFLRERNSSVRCIVNRYLFSSIFLFIYLRFLRLLVLFYEANLKEGVVTDEDLQLIADAVKVKRKRFGRALGLGDDDLDGIVIENPGIIYEQSYQILRKWKQSRPRQSDASYYAIAQALCDRTVDMKRVCLLPSVAKKRN